MKKILVAYYSWSNGNTKKIAEEIANRKHADIVRIETVEPYTGSHSDVVAQGQREVDEAYKPALKPLGVSLDDYDEIIVGTPTWWYTMAPAMKSFLEDHDFTGKTVVPFMTNGGWPGHVIKDMKKALTGAVIKNEKEIRFDSNGGPVQVTEQEEVDSWIDSL